MYGDQRVIVKRFLPSPLESGTVVPLFAVRGAGLPLLWRCRFRFTSVSFDESNMKPVILIHPSILYDTQHLFIRSFIIYSMTSGGCYYSLCTPDDGRGECPKHVE